MHDWILASRGRITHNRVTFPHLRMTTRLAAVALSFTLCLATAAPAFADKSADDTMDDHVDLWESLDQKTTDQIMDEVSELQIRCKDAVASEKSHCVADMINDIKRLKLEYRDAEEIEIREWRLENEPKGMTPELAKAKREFLTEVQKHRRDFYALLRDASKTTFDLHKTIRRTGNASSSSSSSSSSRINTQEERTIRNRCNELKDDVAQRVCVRLQLRLSNVQTRILGASTRSAATQQ